MREKEESQKKRVRGKGKRRANRGLGGRIAEGKEERRLGESLVSNNRAGQS